MGRFKKKNHTQTDNGIHGSLPYDIHKDAEKGFHQVQQILKKLFRTEENTGAQLTLHFRGKKYETEKEFEKGKG